MIIYKYGMKYRGFSIGCQPLENLIEAQEDPTNNYFNILLYSAPLTPEQIASYQLIDLQPKPDVKAALIDLFKNLNKPFIKELDAHSRSEAGKPLLVLIKTYAAQERDNNELIDYINDLKTNNSISAQNEYFELIDYLIEATKTKV